MTPVYSGFEDLLPLLIFVAFWWLTSRRKKEQEPAPPPAPEKQKTPPPTVAGEDSAINPFDVLRQMLLGDLELPRTMEQKPRPPQPDEPMPSGSGDRLDRQAEWAVVEPVRQKKKPLPPRIREERGAATTRRGAVAVKPLPATQPCRPARLPGAAQHVSRRDLRQAVIWSELLAPPVGMRKG